MFRQILSVRNCVRIQFLNTRQFRSTVWSLATYVSNKMAEYGFLENDHSFSTRAIHDGSDPEQWSSWEVIPPISLSTTFKQPSPGNPKDYEYGRSGNPTRNALETCLASIEGAKFGLTFASGLSANTTIIHMLAKGDHIVSGDDLYGGTNRYFKQIAAKFGVETTFVDMIDPANVENAMRPNTKMVWLETPTNPTLRLADIAAIAEIVKKHPGVLTVVDNTFLTSYFQRPLSLGADIVVYSCTKYLNGHSDVIMGAIVTDNNELHDRLRFLQNALGGVPSPFDCYMVIRSLKTLNIRMNQHMINGFAVAKFLENHPLVEKVLHPGLPSHPQHKLALRQSYGHSGMVSFAIKNGTYDIAKKFFNGLKVFTLAESLGGYESLAELPSVMTHASVSAEDRANLGITDGFVRLSVGLESAQDLVQDLNHALNLAASK